MNIQYIDDQGYKHTEVMSDKEYTRRIKLPFEDPDSLAFLNMSDAIKLTHKLIAAGADRAKVIEIVDGYGDPVDWNYHSLDSIIAEVWQSDLNSGDDPDGWIINEICRSFNVTEVTE